MKFVFNYTRVTNRTESIVAGSLIISSSFNHEFVVTYTNFHMEVNSEGGGGGETLHMKGVGMLVGNFELNPKRRPIWAGPKLFFTPKRDHVKTQTIYMFLYFFVCNPKQDLQG